MMCFVQLHRMITVAIRHYFVSLRVLNDEAENIWKIKYCSQFHRSDLPSLIEAYRNSNVISLL